MGIWSPKGKWTFGHLRENGHLVT